MGQIQSAFHSPQAKNSFYIFKLLGEREEGKTCMTFKFQ